MLEMLFSKFYIPPLEIPNEGGTFVSIIVFITLALIGCVLTVLGSIMSNEVLIFDRSAPV